ncbi:hypothetical protein BHM03_00057162 [Ensete ventricosum]|nr:hypothetical protein BHM03_00057162 [Ensete ventricosum]
MMSKKCVTLADTVKPVKAENADISERTLDEHLRDHYLHGGAAEGLEAAISIPNETMSSAEVKMAYRQTHSQLTVAVDFGRLDRASGGEIERPGHVHGDTEIVSLLQRLADALRALREDVGDAGAARPARTRNGAVVGDV